MKGAAPKLSKMGSHVRVQKNIHPNFARERYEVRHNSNTSSDVISRIPAAKTSVIRWAISSPLRNLRTNARSPVWGGTSCAMVVAVADIRGLLDERNSFLFLFNNGF